MLFIIFLILAAALFGWSETLSTVAEIFAKILAWTMVFITALWYLAPINGVLAVVVALIISIFAFRSIFLH